MPFIVVQPLHAFRTRVAIIETVAPWRGLGTFATDCDATELLTAEHADNAEKCRRISGAPRRPRNQRLKWFGAGLERLPRIAKPRSFLTADHADKAEKCRRISGAPRRPRNQQLKWFGAGLERLPRIAKPRSFLTAEHADNAEKCRQTATFLFNPVKTPPFAWPPRSKLRGIKAKRPLRGSGSV